MSNVIIPIVTRKAIRTKSRFRNGLYPEAGPVTRIQDEANRIVAYRGKQWTFTAPCASVPAAGGTSARQRWRTFIHTSTHHACIDVRFLCMPSNNAGTPLSLVTFTAVGGGVIGSAEFYYGASTDSDTADNIAVGHSRTIELAGTANVDLDPDTDYEVNVYDVGDARTMSVCLFERELPHTTANGYVAAGVVATQPILDVHRSAPTTVLRNAWTTNGQPLITWSSSLDSAPRTITSATTTNLLDGVTGAPTAATAGYTLSLANRTTLRRSPNIPCLMRVYGKFAGAPTAAHVYLANSAGTLLADCEVDSNTEGWFSSGGFDLPATDGKYDLQFAADGASLLTVRAVAIYEHE